MLQVLVVDVGTLKQLASLLCCGVNDIEQCFDVLCILVCMLYMHIAIVYI